MQDQEKTETSLQAFQPLQEVLEPDTAKDLAVALHDASKVARAKAQIDISDTASILRFGSTTQTDLQVISQSMLAGVRSKDLGPAGDSLKQMVVSIRGFSAAEIDPNKKQGFVDRILRRATPLAQFMAQFETVQSQVDQITDELLRHEHALLKDIRSLDLLYEKTLDFYRELAVYIAAGEERIVEIDQVEIPALAAALEKAPEDAAILRASELRDLRQARDDLERRVHDLRLTRQVTMQSLPSIRLVQENDKSLVSKINSTLTNTVPLWETQLAQAITIHRSAAAAKAVKGATDLTNELLTANAANLREANSVARKEIERGVFDLDAIKAANADLIATIEESLVIADEGKAKRAAAEGDLAVLESELKGALSAAKSRSA